MPATTKVSLQNIKALVSSGRWRARQRGADLYSAVEYLVAYQNLADKVWLMRELYVAAVELYPTDTWSTSPFGYQGRIGETMYFTRLEKKYGYQAMLSIIDRAITDTGGSNDSEY